MAKSVSAQVRGFSLNPNVIGVDAYREVKGMSLKLEEEIRQVNDPWFLEIGDQFTVGGVFHFREIFPDGIHS